MTLGELLSKLNKSTIKHKTYVPYGTDEEVEVSGIVCDSRKAAPGVIFAATKGGHRDAHDFIPQAAAAGSPAVICERKIEYPIPQIVCPDARSAMGEVAALLYDEPANKLKMIALTGTNGKTTSTFMTQAILNNSHIKTGLIGTVLYDDGEKIEEAEHTTPEGCDIQALLDRMVSNGCKACVMEVSSHSTVQGRISGILFDRAGFTNLTQDHLDFHKNMENYFLAKAALFENFMKSSWKGVINIDDDYGKRLYDSLGKRVFSYSMLDDNADFYASIENISLEGLDIKVKTPESPDKTAVKLPLLGSYNVLNALQSLALAWSLGVSAKAALAALESMPQVPGRLERYSFDNGVSCVIDFAHSPDGLEKVLTAVRPICGGRLIVVFGAGGDRDTTKRPIMGEIASRLGDHVVVTSDNPRSEEPASITAAIEVGVKMHDTPYEIVVDRRSGIYRGLDIAEKDDVVVIAGRGPETHQILKDGPIPLVDKEIMRDWTALRGRKVL